MSESRPVVSIGMPVFNGEKFIREALDSLLSQTFSEFEIIISDNASTDATESICREYVMQDKRIRYVRQLTNRGAFNNFKYVLDEAVGEYFMWAASDDVWDMNWINMLYPIARDNQCMAYGIVQSIDENGKNISHPANNRSFNYTGAVILRRLKYFASPAFLGKANPIYGLCSRVRFTSEVIKAFQMNTSGSDMLALYAMLNSNEIISCQTVYLYKRIHSGCAAGESVSTRIGLFKKLPDLLLQHATAQYKRIVDYVSMSSGGERVIILAMTPIIIIHDMLYLLLKKAKYW